MNSRSGSPRPSPTGRPSCRTTGRSSSRSRSSSNPSLASRVGLAQGRKVNLLPETGLRPLEHPLLHPAEPAVLEQPIPRVRVVPARRPSRSIRPTSPAPTPRPSSSAGAWKRTCRSSATWTPTRGLGRPPGHPVRRLGGSDEGRSREMMTALLYQDDDCGTSRAERSPTPAESPGWKPRPIELAGLHGALAGLGARPGHRRRRPDPGRTRQVTLESPGLVDPGRRLLSGLETRDRRPPAEILRVNRTMRGAVAPAGPASAGLHLSARSVSSGAVLSAVGLLVWLGLLAFGMATLQIRNRRVTRSELPGQDSNLEKQDQNLL